MPYVVLLALVVSVSVPRGSAPIEDELVLQTPVSKFVVDAALKAFAGYAKEKSGVTAPVEHFQFAGTPVSRPDRRVEGEARGRHLLGRGVGALRQAPRSRDSSVSAVVPGPRRCDPGGTRQAQGDPPQGPHRILDRDGARAVRAGSTSAAAVSPAPGRARAEGLGGPPPPKLKGGIVARCAPSRSSSSHATYEIILQGRGDQAGWDWLKRLGGNSGIFTARSRDVPSVVARASSRPASRSPPHGVRGGSGRVRHQVRGAQNAFVTPEPMAILAGAKHPRAARAFIEFLLTERGQRGYGAGPLPHHAEVQGPGPDGLGRREGRRVHRRGDSYFETETTNVYRRRRAEALPGGERAVPEGHRGPSGPARSKARRRPGPDPTPDDPAARRRLVRALIIGVTLGLVTAAGLPASAGAPAGARALPGRGHRGLPGTATPPRARPATSRASTSREASSSTTRFRARGSSRTSPDPETGIGRWTDGGSSGGPGRGGRAGRDGSPPVRRSVGYLGLGGCPTTT